MAKLGFRDDCKQSYRDLAILTFPSHYILENLMYVKMNEDMYRVHREVHSYGTRQRDMLVPAYCRLKRCQNGPGYLAIKFYNKLPSTIKSLPVYAFKAAVRKILLDNAFYSNEEFLIHSF